MRRAGRSFYVPPGEMWMFRTAPWFRFPPPLKAATPVGSASVSYTHLDVYQRQAESRLLASGTSVLSATTRLALESDVSAGSVRSQRRYRGDVLPGGTVDIDAGLGYLIARSGSLIDVQGASGTLNLSLIHI